jgi:hypothetical protein
MTSNLEEIQNVLSSFYANFPFYDDVEELHCEERDFIRHGHPSVYILHDELLIKHSHLCRIIELANEDKRISFIQENYAEMFCDDSPTDQIQSNHDLETVLLDFLFGITEEMSEDSDMIIVNSLLDFGEGDLQQLYDRIWAEYTDVTNETAGTHFAPKESTPKHGHWGTAETKQLIWGSLTLECRPFLCLQELIRTCVPARLKQDAKCAQESIYKRLAGYYKLLAEDQPTRRANESPTRTVPPDYFDSGTWSKPFICQDLWAHYDPKELLVKYPQL